MTKNKKKILILICLILLALLIFQIVRIYAVFHTEVVGNVEFKNGTWNIIVNGTDITNGVNTEFVIDKVNASEDSHVKPGKIAPGLSGNFEITINPENTDVSVRYDVILNQENLESSIKIKSIQQTEGGNSLIQTAENQYTGIIPLDDIQNGVLHKIKVEIEWINDGTHDTEDTALGTNLNKKFEIPITVHAIQYLGETITPFTQN